MATETIITSTTWQTGTENNKYREISQQICQLRSLFIKHGGKIHDSVEICYRRDRGFHLRARGKIPRETTLIICPYTVTLSILTGHEWPEGFVTRYQQDLEVVTRFDVMNAYIQGSSHLLWPYIQLLPSPINARSFETPMYWNEEELAQIKGTNLHAAREKRMSAWQKEHAAAVKILAESGLPNLEQYTW